MAKAVSSNGSGRLPVAAWARLYEERVQRGITQLEAARLCGVHQQTFSGWEQKKRRPAKRWWAKIAAFLHLSDSAFAAELADVFPFYI